MISPSDILIYVFAYGGQPVRLLNLWLTDLTRRGYTWKFAPTSQRLDVARNQAVVDFLRTGKKWMVIIDRDVCPLKGELATENILTSEEPMAFSGWIAPFTTGHWGDGDFGDSCCKLRSDVLRSIENPWFGFDRNETGAIASCCCNWFKRKAELAGWKPKMVAKAGHMQEIVLAPEGGMGKHSFLWPQQLENDGNRMENVENAPQAGAAVIEDQVSVHGNCLRIGAWGRSTYDSLRKASISAADSELRCDIHGGHST